MEATKKSNHPLFTPLQISAVRSDLFEGNVSMSNKEDALCNMNDLLIVETLSKDQPPLISLPFDIKISIVMALMTSLIIGSFFKYIMYSFIWQTKSQNDGKRSRPITILIYSRSIIHHIFHVWMWIWITASMLGDTPVADSIGTGFCKYLQVTGLFGSGYWTMGSLGIAVYRVLYIKHENWVKYGIGERLLLSIILSISITLCLVLAILYNLEIHDHRFALNMCQGISETHAQILIDYGLSREEPLITTTYIQTTILFIGIAMQTTELCIYIWFFRYRYKNDNGNIKKLLTEDVIRARNIKNVTTFLGQFYGFITEYAYAVAILVILLFAGEQTMDLKAFANLSRLMGFGLMSAVEVISSPALRAHLRRKFKIK